MPSKVGIVSLALTILGEDTVTSLDGQQKRQKVAKGLYEPTRRALLTEINWRFATHTQDLARQVTAPTDDRYSYQYSLPTDPRILKVKRLDPGGKYEIQGDNLLSNNTTQQLNYVADVDESVMPAYFEMLLAMRLAVLMAIPLTKKQSRMDAMQVIYDAYEPTAKHADASQQPNDAVEDAPFVDARA